VVLGRGGIGRRGLPIVIIVHSRIFTTVVFMSFRVC
jgi:hypothetical protein